MSEILSVKEYGIAYKIEKEVIPSGSSLESFIENVNKYISIMEMEAVEFHMKNRDESHMTYYETLAFFRNSERLKNIKHILQYQIKFINGFPDEDRVDTLPENPFIQFKEFVIYMVEQLKTSDVEESIFREYKELGLLKNSTRWYYKGTINRAYEEIIELVVSARKAIPEDYKKLLISLKKHSIFWFSVRRENLDRIRKSDIFIYRLSNILLKKLTDN